MKLHNVLLCVAWMAGTSAVACAETEHGGAKIDTQAPHEALALAGARIKSLAEFYAYDFSIPPLANPLSRLSQDARQRFVKSLKFDERGIAGYATGDLRSELTAEQIYDILVLFGVQDDIYLFSDARVSTRRDRDIMENAHAFFAVDARGHRRADPFSCRSFGRFCGSRCPD